MNEQFSINVITTTMGRETLPILIESLYKYLKPWDYYTVISDCKHEEVEEVLQRYNFECKVIHIRDPKEFTDYSKRGHHLINKYKHLFEGDFIMFGDDDDRYVDNIFDFIREQLKEKDTMYIFKHKWGYFSHWTQPVVNNIGKCMVAIPNAKENLPPIQEDLLGDFHWFPELNKTFKAEFIDKIIYLVRDSNL